MVTSDLSLFISSFQFHLIFNLSNVKTDILCLFRAFLK